MKFTKLISLMILVVSLVTAGFISYAYNQTDEAATTAETKDGKTLFLDAKCNNCHGIASQAIEAKNKKSPAPDLSDLGAKHNADFIKKYITKEETMNDKKHPVAYKGSETDLAMFADWLASLKPPAELAK